ncbi:MAG: hypothetical protein FRX48_05062 [Lasallia pustulata]|uniref:Uncharacterized protein n=1 Tax=Lasallia pustulata TaxID=136370 RepID=A0A5M8PP29_9LECA|nr:MAG: hypothetical protein FRX48_05062 [Lasallia pustulata]
MAINIFELYFQFLQSIHELGFPLSSTNVAGLTPLGELVQLYTRFWRYGSLVTLLSLDMLGIGAELPLFTRETIRFNTDTIGSFAQESTQNPDLAKG